MDAGCTRDTASSHFRVWHAYSDVLLVVVTAARRLPVLARLQLYSNLSIYANIEIFVVVGSDTLHMLPTGHSRPVDLALAHTYIPGITCLLRAALLIIAMTWTERLPTGTVLLVVSTFLFLDRSIRLENIFDSSAVLCTLQASYMIKSTIQCSQPMFTSVPMVFSAAQSLLIAISTLLVMDFNVLPLCSGKHKRLVITLQAVLLSLIMQSPAVTVPTIGRVVTIQSFVFVVLSLVWTYAVGIHDMIQLLGCSSRVPTGR